MTHAIFLALLPVIVLIGLGSALRRAAFVNVVFWQETERLGYFVLLPALFLDGVATAPLTALPIAGLGASLVCSILVVSVVLILSFSVLRLDGPAFTSVFQGGVRFNNYVGVPVAFGLFGSQGVALAAVCNAVAVPLINVLCILVFARHGSKPLDARGILWQVASNPLLLACVGGIVLQTSGVGIPASLEPAIRALGAASLPMGLLCVGAALDFGSAKTWIRPVVIASVVKFIAMPLAMAGLGVAFGLHGPAFIVGLLFQALPTSSAGYVMARRLGGDAPLMAGVTAVQTIVAIAALPLILSVLSRLATP